MPRKKVFQIPFGEEKRASLWTQTLGPEECELWGVNFDFLASDMEWTEDELALSGENTAERMARYERYLELRDQHDRAMRKEWIDGAERFLFGSPKDYKLSYWMRPDGGDWEFVEKRISSHLAGLDSALMPKLPEHFTVRHGDRMQVIS